MPELPNINIYTRLIEELSACLNRESEEDLVLFRPSDGVQKEIDYLASRCVEGRATTEELAEYTTVLTFYDYLNLLKLNAENVRR